MTVSGSPTRAHKKSDLPWNEIVVDGRGNAYLNNIGFDMMAGEEARPGIVALVTPDGSTRQVADGVRFPNGVVVTPDNSTLILAESYALEASQFRTKTVPWMSVNLDDSREPSLA